MALFDLAPASWLGLVMVWGAAIAAGVLLVRCSRSPAWTARHLVAVRVRRDPRAHPDRVPRADAPGGRPGRQAGPERRRAPARPRARRAAPRSHPGAGAGGATGTMTRRERATPTSPARGLRRVAPGDHPLGRRRRLRPHEQRRLLRADRHRGQRPPRGGDRRRHPLRCRPSAWWPRSAAATSARSATRSPSTSAWSSTRSATSSVIYRIGLFQGDPDGPGARGGGRGPVRARVRRQQRRSSRAVPVRPLPDAGPRGRRTPAA